MGLNKGGIEAEPLVTFSSNVIMGGAALASLLAAEVAGCSAFSELICVNVLYCLLTVGQQVCRLLLSFVQCLSVTTRHRSSVSSIMMTRLVRQSCERR